MADVYSYDEGAGWGKKRDEAKCFFTSSRQAHSLSQKRPTNKTRFRHPKPQKRGTGTMASLLRSANHACPPAPSLPPRLNVARLPVSRCTICALGVIRAIPAIAEDYVHAVVVTGPWSTTSTVCSWSLDMPHGDALTPTADGMHQYRRIRRLYQQGRAPADGTGCCSAALEQTLPCCAEYCLQAHASGCEGCRLGCFR